MAIKQANQVAAAAAETVAADQAVTGEVIEATAEVLSVEGAQAAETAPAAESAPVVDRSEESSAVLEDVPEEEEQLAEQPPAVQNAAASTQGNTQQVAVPSATGSAVSVAEKRSALMTQIISQLAEEGFEGTELDYSSFLNITLNKQIETSEGTELPNSGFLVRLAGSRLKYCFRNNNPVEDEVEVAYSYIKDDHLNPESEVAQKIAKWKEEGLELADVKVYTEVLAVMLDDKLDGEQAGELNGRLVTIQVAPTSRGRWAGYLAQLKMNNVKDVSGVSTLVRRGKKVESGKFPFYPWDFVNKGKLDLSDDAE